MNMGRRKEQEDGSNISTYVYGSQLKKVVALIDTGAYRNRAEIVRDGIDFIYEAKCSDPVIMLQEEKKKLESVIQKLESIINERKNEKITLQQQYMERKNNLSVNGYINYEKVSKKWINHHLEDALKVFPGKNIDEIYSELEECCHA
jgi:Arc/MetJ-type ribon-helix-helix transcriptional regulator